MAVDPKVRVLEHAETYTNAANTDKLETLDHAKQQVRERGLEDYFIVDVDSHREPHSSWGEMAAYFPDEVVRENFSYRVNSQKTNVPYANLGFSTGHIFMNMFGRIQHGQADILDEAVARDVTLCREAMESFGIDVQVVFPTTLLAIGMTPTAEGEAQIAYAYNKWFIERICSEEPRIKFLPILPMRTPEMCLRIIREFGGKPGVSGFLVTSPRFIPVHDNQYMQMYAELQEMGHPLAFHAGPTWDDEWMRTMNRFISVHALSFVHCNLVHMTNWIINGIPERFPNLRPIWIESGIAWIPYLMQRLDSEFLKRTNEAPLLKRLPSEYMKDMFYTSQPMERDNLELLESTMKAMNAETQLLYVSDWPHWDFDLPSAIYDIPFLSDQAKRNILGENARKLFNL